MNEVIEGSGTVTAMTAYLAAILGKKTFHISICALSSNAQHDWKNAQCI